MVIPVEKTTYLVKRVPSIFTNRVGREDCYVSRLCQTHGARESDGKKYTCVARIEVETGEYLRNYETLPSEITLPLLRQWGFLDVIESKGET